MNSPDYLPPEWMHSLLPADAQMTLRDAHARCQGIGDATRREAIIETAERRVRKLCPDAFRGDE